MNLGSTVNSGQVDGIPSISADGLTLFFVSNRPGGSGDYDLWSTMRDTKHADWGTPSNLGPTVNSPAADSRPRISADGLSLYFSSMRPGGSGWHDIYLIARATKEDDWGTPVNLGTTVNSSVHDGPSSISADGLLLFFSSGRPGGVGDHDLWVTTRPTLGEPWGPPLNPGGPLNTTYGEWCPSISPDGLSLYFGDYQAPRPGGVGGEDIWQAPIVPIVDFNGDGIVDAGDMCVMVEHWGENYSLCDIGPTPLGDGIVDVQDLIVLAEHLFEEVSDPTLIAHWPLDETQGGTAYNSAFDCDGTLVGEPVWQPDGGVVAGALQFDGIYDYVSTPFVLDPANGKFSVVAWIKGGAPGQAVLSQADGASWLRADFVEGNLMADLRSGRSGGSLLSQTCITDGDWHSVGFMWDGSYRHLYVDGAEVANDTTPLSRLGSAEGGLYFGAGSTLAPDAFWSGLIDDVRIYNRSISP
jgi:Tol biopolymer transport system component